jgi:hypothetical protein
VLRLEAYSKALAAVPAFNPRNRPQPATPIPQDRLEEVELIRSIWQENGGSYHSSDFDRAHIYHLNEIQVDLGNTNGNSYQVFCQMLREWRPRGRPAEFSPEEQEASKCTLFDIICWREPPAGMEPDDAALWEDLPSPEEDLSSSEEDLSSPE